MIGGVPNFFAFHSYTRINRVQLVHYHFSTHTNYIIYFFCSLFSNNNNDADAEIYLESVFYFNVYVVFAF